MGRWAVSWPFSWAVSRIPRVAFARGGLVAFDVGQRKRGYSRLTWHGVGAVLVAFEARCVWSGQRS